MIIMNKFRWQSSAFPLFRTRQLTAGQHRVSAQENCFKWPRFLHCLLKVFFRIYLLYRVQYALILFRAVFFSAAKTDTFHLHTHVSEIFHPWRIFIWGWYYLEFSYASITFWFGSDMLSFGFPYVAEPNKGFSRISRRSGFSARSPNTHAQFFLCAYLRSRLSVCLSVQRLYK